MEYTNSYILARKIDADTALELAKRIEHPVVLTSTTTFLWGFESLALKVESCANSGYMTYSDAGIENDLRNTGMIQTTSDLSTWAVTMHPYSGEMDMLNQTAQDLRDNGCSAVNISK